MLYQNLLKTRGQFVYLCPQTNILNGNAKNYLKLDLVEKRLYYYPFYHLWPYPYVMTKMEYCHLKKMFRFYFLARYRKAETVVISLPDISKNVQTAYECFYHKNYWFLGKSKIMVMTYDIQSKPDFTKSINRYEVVNGQLLPHKKNRPKVKGKPTKRY